MRRVVGITVWLAALGWCGTSLAFGQQAPPPQLPPPQPPVSPVVLPVPPAVLGLDTALAGQTFRVATDHWKLVREVEIEWGDKKLFADELEVFTDRDLLTAKGNVTLTTPTQTISADTLEYNMRTERGVFHHASGSARTSRDAGTAGPEFGATEPSILFYGEMIEKIGERKYRLTKGAFTSCVQPKPRWELVAGTVVLNLDHYAFLRNSILKVKGVPILYVPAVYYPINKEDRATGFLMPIYGTSSLRGQTLSNAFFWALGRSHDATFMHDWFSRTGQGMGAEYRYTASAASRGNASFYRLMERPKIVKSADGTETSYYAGAGSYQVRGDVSQKLPLGLTARGRAEYFSSIRTQQTFNTNVYQATTWTRGFSGGASGSWGAYSMGVDVGRSEYFYNASSSSLTGSWPRVVFSRGEQPIGRLPVYFALSTDLGQVINETHAGDTIREFNLWRGNLSPAVRFPFTKWPFLTINSSLAWRYSWFSEQYNAAGQLASVPISRSYFDMSARITGPVFNRIWDRPNSRYAEKIKHAVEPWVFLQRITAIENYKLLPKSDYSDYVIGQTTKVSYGLNNRIYAKMPLEGGRTQSTQIIGVAIQQSYYSDANAGTYDFNYSTLYGRAKVSRFSPALLTVEVTPTKAIGGSFRAEYDVAAYLWQSLGASGSAKVGEWLTTSGGWNLRRYNNVTVGSQLSNHYLNSDTSVRLGEKRRVGGLVSFNYDLQNGFFMQKRFMGFYNAQCCGVTAEFQTFNFAGVYYPGYRPPVLVDRRFNISITLAGLGTFSNFLGFFGIGQGYR